MRNSIRPVLTLIAAGLLLAAGAQAQDTAAPAKATATAKPAAKTGRNRARNCATRPRAWRWHRRRTSANQLQIANRVLTGNAQCEFNQGVMVEPVAESRACSA